MVFRKMMIFELLGLKNSKMALARSTIWLNCLVKGKSAISAASLKGYAQIGYFSLKIWGQKDLLLKGSWMNEYNTYPMFVYFPKGEEGLVWPWNLYDSMGILFYYFCGVLHTVFFSKLNFEIFTFVLLVYFYLDDSSMMTSNLVSLFIFYLIRFSFEGVKFWWNSQSKWRVVFRFKKIKKMQILRNFRSHDLVPLSNVF